MTIAIFVEPKSLNRFIEVTAILENLPLENNYKFQPLDLVFSKAMISNYVWINMDLKEYLKLEYCIQKLKA